MTWWDKINGQPLPEPREGVPTRREIANMKRYELELAAEKLGIKNVARFSTLNLRIWVAAKAAGITPEEQR